MNDLEREVLDAAVEWAERWKTGGGAEVRLKEAVDALEASKKPFYAQGCGVYYRGRRIAETSGTTARETADLATRIATLLNLYGRTG